VVDDVLFNHCSHLLFASSCLLFVRFCVDASNLFEYCQRTKPFRKMQFQAFSIAVSAV
jgi:hypothetical protein